MAPTLRTDPVHVRVPATSANLGPGFDTFGLALGLHDELVARVTSSGVAVEVEGQGAGAVPRDESHLVVRAMRRGFEALGIQPDGLRLGCLNRIPHARGLGSSSAAIVGGLALARALVVEGDRLLPDDGLYQLANELEGHPDNVAPAIFGGFTTSWIDDARAGVVTADVHPDVVAFACVPPNPLSTEQARGLLPAQVPHADAARNAGRAALLVTALTRRPDLLLPATEDALHQDYRADAYASSMLVVRALRAAGVAAAISGAGPTVLALATSATRDDVASTVASVDPGFDVRALAIDTAGVVAGPVPA